MTLLLGKKQEYGNITIVPILNDSPLKLDILDLTTGFKMGLVEVSECEQSTVGTIMVKNNATSPLLFSRWGRSSWSKTEQNYWTKYVNSSEYQHTNSS